MKGVIDKSREIRRRELELIDDVPIPDNKSTASTELPLAHKATADEDSGQVTVKACDSDGVVSGSEKTWEVLP